MAELNDREKQDEAGLGSRRERAEGEGPDPVGAAAPTQNESEPAPPARSPRRKALLRRLGNRLLKLRPTRAFFKDISIRVYSLAIFTLLCWTGWLAATYLRDTVFRPTHIPPNLLEWQGRLDVAALRQKNVPGMTGPAGRAPLGPEEPGRGYGHRGHDRHGPA